MLGSTNIIGRRPTWI